MKTNPWIRFFSFALALLMIPSLASCRLWAERPSPEETPDEQTGFSEETPSENGHSPKEGDYRLTLSNPSAAFGSVSGEGSYNADCSVNVVATPEILGYTLEGWYLDGVKVSDALSYTFSMPSKDLSLEARWKPREELSGFTFTANKTTCTVTGVTDPSVTFLSLPSFVTDLGEGVFAGCKSLEELHLPASVTKIPANAFRGCSALRSLRLDGTIVSVAENAFLDCNPAVLNRFGGAYYLKGKTDFDWLIMPVDPAVTEITVHPNAKQVADGAFRDCALLEEISLPAGIGRISKYAFFGCSSLSRILYAGSVVSWSSVEIEEGNRPLLQLPISCADGKTAYETRGYGRSLLTGNELYVYDLLKTHLLADSPSESFSVDSARQVTPDQCQNAFEIFILDHPECFWIGQAFSYRVTEENRNAISQITPQYLFEGNALREAKKELEKVVKDILENLPEGDSFLQTVYLHDAVAKRVTYQHNDLDQTSYGALVKGNAVCAGYAAAYQLLLQEAGYKAWSVNGYSRNQNHRWNVIWLDHATCVYTDVTWDDSEDGITYRYFGLSLEEFSATHRPRNAAELPACEHEGYGYFDHPTTQDMVISLGDSFEKLAPLLRRQTDGSYLAHLYYDGTSVMEWIAKNQAKIAAHCGFSPFSVNVSDQNEELLLLIYPS